MKKHLLLFSAAMLGISLAASAQCSFTWSQPQPNVIDFVEISSPPQPNATLYMWDFGDTQYGSGSGTLSHTYGVPGTYIVCLNLVDSLNMYFCSFCDTITVTGSIICQVDLQIYGVSAATCATCPNGQASAYAMYGTAPYTYAWSNGDTGQTASSFLPGTYTCCVTDANGCTDCAVVTINSMPAPNCSISFWGNVQNGGQVAFSAYVQNVNSNHQITWDFGDLSSGTGLYPWHQYAASGTYNVCAFLYDSVNTCADTFCTSIVVNVTNPPCMAGFYVQMDSVITNQAWIYNISTGSPTMTYQWYWGDNTPADTGAYPSHVYQMNGSYNICLVVVDQANSCTDTMCQYIQVVRLSQQAQQSPLYVNVVAPPLGVNDPVVDLNWNLFPSPAHSTITINGNFNSDDHYIITDLAGRTVASGRFGSNVIDITNLSSGTFVFTIVTDNGEVQSKRFIRE